MASMSLVDIDLKQFVNEMQGGVARAKNDDILG